MSNKKVSKIIIRGKLDKRIQQSITNYLEQNFDIKVIWKQNQTQDQNQQSEIRNVLPSLMKKFDSYQKNLQKIQLKDYIQGTQNPYNLGPLKSIFNNQQYRDIQDSWINYLEKEAETDILKDKKIINKSIYYAEKNRLLELALKSQKKNNSEPFKNYLAAQKTTNYYADNTEFSQSTTFQTTQIPFNLIE